MHKNYLDVVLEEFVKKVILKYESFEQDPKIFSIVWTCV